MRIWAFILTVFLLAGCSTMHKSPTLQDKMEKDYSAVLEAEKTPPPSVVFFIEEHDSLERFKNHPAAQDQINLVSGGGESLANIVRLIQMQTSLVMVPKDLENIDAGIVSFRKMPLLKVLQFIRSRYDVEFNYDRQADIFEVKKDITRRIILPPILDSQSGVIGGEDGVSVAAEPDHLRDIIMETAKTLEVQVVAVSETTGLMHLKGRPSKVRELSRIIESEATERLKFVTLHVMFLEVRRNNSFDRDFRLEYLPNLSFLGNDVFGTFKFAMPVSLLPNDQNSSGSTQSLAGNGQSSDDQQGGIPVPSSDNGDTNGDDGSGLLPAVAGSSMFVPTDKASAGVRGSKFASLLTLLEQWGDSELVTAPAVMTPNGVPVSFDVVDEIGYWEPGDIDTSLGDSFGKSITEGKPEFVSDEVGLKLRIRPKIIEDAATGDFMVELDIALENSKVREYASIQWQRSSDTDPVMLSKPLKSTKRVSSRAVLRPDELLLLARLDNKDNAGAKAGLPGTVGSDSILAKPFVSEASRINESQLFIVVDAILPPNLTNTKEEPVEQKVKNLSAYR
ncbi:hypothetical protein [Geoalkalibacter subterraneus]|uniref:Type II/III secretion system secretin-like domain-containing protein n=1 Tax=Geoalkalibacter subterraneus TaxID=483547 RepID=A0A0B5FL47_9BACT|nr:hypothetical protein [Geoalkalibacter subterraneus]AJF08113.1 hypothetical protein GSUB_16510 [Geoalkalibacter subterraneus]